MPTATLTFTATRNGTGDTWANLNNALALDGSIATMPTNPGDAKTVAQGQMVVYTASGYSGIPGAATISAIRLSSFNWRRSRDYSLSHTIFMTINASGACTALNAGDALAIAVGANQNITQYAPLTLTGTQPSVAQLKSADFGIIVQNNETEPMDKSLLLDTGQWGLDYIAVEVDYTGGGGPSDLMKVYPATGIKVF